MQWVQRRHNCSPAGSSANCVMTLYLFKVHLQMFLYIPITQKCQILDCCTLVANERHVFMLLTYSSPSIGTATLVGYGLLNYRWVFSAGRFLQSAVASGTSNPQPGGPVIRTFQLPPPGDPRLKRRERTPAADGGIMGEKSPRILPNVATSTSLLGSFTCRRFMTWYRRLYFPSEGRRAEDFFARKIRRLRPGLNPLTSRPRKPLPPSSAKVN